MAQDEIRFRVEVLTGIQRIESKLNQHSDEDERRFEELESRLTMVNSSVFNGEKTFSKYDGIKIGIGIAVGFFLLVAGLVAWLLQYLGNRP